ncbi:hypothetical protein V757_03550 [Pelistega indica]|uniref:Uncharacterized protein n=1 Tax=Pelistega indica TaxID=1414851 RepID=V8G832_9BURK|nr:hypothetical protein V757_03550 [Pelistega indica]
MSFLGGWVLPKGEKGGIMSIFPAEAAINQVNKLIDGGLMRRGRLSELS